MNGKATTTGTDTRMSHSLEGHEYPRVSAHPIAHEDDGEGKGLIFGKDFPFPERGFDHEAAGVSLLRRAEVSIVGLKTRW